MAEEQVYCQHMSQVKGWGGWTDKPFRRNGGIFWIFFSQQLTLFYHDQKDTLCQISKQMQIASVCCWGVSLTWKRQICLSGTCNFLPAWAAARAPGGTRRAHAGQDMPCKRGQEGPWVCFYHSQRLTCYRRGQREAGYQGAEAQSQEIWGPQSVFLGKAGKGGRQATEKKAKKNTRKRQG